MDRAIADVAARIVFARRLKWVFLVLPFLLPLLAAVLFDSGPFFGCLSVAGPPSGLGDFLYRNMASLLCLVFCFLCACVFILVLHAQVLTLPEEKLYFIETRQNILMTIALHSTNPT